jgi:hypothetical protein
MSFQLQIVVEPYESKKFIIVNKKLFVNLINFDSRKLLT